MAMEAIKAVAEAEEQAAEEITRAKERARRALSQAHADAEALKRTREKEADEACAILLQEADAQGEQLIRDAARYADGEADDLRKTAGKKIVAAAAAVAERIVSGAWQS